MNFTTIILAGGRSSRMGSNKALIPYEGKFLVQYPIDLALTFSPDILISTNTRDLDYLGFQVVNDLLPVNAPLAGIHAGLKTSRSDWCLVLTCDMPNVNRTLIDRLLTLLNDDHMLVLPSHDGYIEPLCGFYHRSLVSQIEKNFTDGKLSLLDLPKAVPHLFLAIEDIPAKERDFLFRNVNEQRDLRP